MCLLAYALCRCKILPGSSFTLQNSVLQISPLQGLLAAWGFKQDFSNPRSPGSGLPWEHGHFGRERGEPLVPGLQVWTSPEDGHGTGCDGCHSLGLLGLCDGCHHEGNHMAPQTRSYTLLKPNFRIGNWPFIFGTCYIMVQSISQLNLTMVYCAVVNRNWLTNLLWC